MIPASCELLSCHKIFEKVRSGDQFGVTLGSVWDGVGIVFGRCAYRAGTVWGWCWDRVEVVWGSLFHHLGIFLGSSWDRFWLVFLFFVCVRVWGGSLLSADSGELSIFFSWEVPCPPGCFMTFAIVLSCGYGPALGVV